MNLVSGSVAVIFAIDGHLVWAAIFICAAAVFDFLDGFAARALKAYSEIGKELDSLADVVSFGVAPGAILFTLLEFSLFGKNDPIHEISGKWFEWLILFSAFLLPVFGAIRLARFNTNTSNENFFPRVANSCQRIVLGSNGFNAPITKICRIPAIGLHNKKPRDPWNLYVGNDGINYAHVFDETKITAFW